MSMDNRKGRNTKRAQILSVDALIAAIAFAVILVLALELWSSVTEKMALVERRSDLERIARGAAAVLVETPGVPANWSNLSSALTTDNVPAIGLAQGSSMNGLAAQHASSAGLLSRNALVLDARKVARLVQLDAGDHETVKRLLGIAGPGYEFALRLAVWDGSSYALREQLGQRPDAGAVHVVQRERIALLHGNWTRLTLQVWDACSGVLCG